MLILKSNFNIRYDSIGFYSRKVDRQTSTKGIKNNGQHFLSTYFMVDINTIIIHNSSIR